MNTLLKWLPTSFRHKSKDVQYWFDTLQISRNTYLIQSCSGGSAPGRIYQGIWEMLGKL